MRNLFCGPKRKLWIGSCIGVLVVVACLIVYFTDKSHMEVAGGQGPVYSGSEDHNTVALTINVVWGEEYLDSILQTLKENNVRATFFIGGQWAENNELLLNKIVEDGHEIGSHAYSHEHMSQLSYEENIMQIQQAARVIYDACKVTPVLFAPPYGEFNDTVLKAADDLGCTTVMWSVDTIDWKGNGADAVVSRIEKKCHNGAIILAHPTQDTADALQEVINIVRESGREFVTAGELIEQGTETN